MDAWTLYWITRLDNINNFGHVLTVMGPMFAVVVLVLLVLAAVTKGPEYVTQRQWILTGIGWGLCAFVSFLGILVLIFVPTTKEMAVIYTLPKIVNNENVQEEAGEIYALAKEWLKQQVEPNDSD